MSRNSSYKLLPSVAICDLAQQNQQLSKYLETVDAFRQAYDLLLAEHAKLQTSANDFKRDFSKRVSVEKTEQQRLKSAWVSIHKANKQLQSQLLEKDRQIQQLATQVAVLQMQLLQTSNALLMGASVLMQQRTRPQVTVFSDSLAPLSSAELPPPLDLAANSDELRSPPVMRRHRSRSAGGSVDDADKWTPWGSSLCLMASPQSFSGLNLEETNDSEAVFDLIDEAMSIKSLEWDNVFDSKESLAELESSEDEIGQLLSMISMQ
jgi:hypothetical protein